MNETTSSFDAARLYSVRTESYVRFVRTVGYPQGLRAFFLEWNGLASDLRVLDAGCGTGIVTLALLAAAQRRDLPPAEVHGFDLTPAMLERFAESLEERGLGGVELRQANVLELGALPESWSGYDLVVSASMLEYVPRARLRHALGALRQRLRGGGRFLLFISRRNWLTRPLIGRWWRAHLYSRRELEEALHAAGFAEVSFRRFPRRFRHLGLWGHVVEARASDVERSSLPDRE